MLKTLTKMNIIVAFASVFSLEILFVLSIVTTLEGNDLTAIASTFQICAPAVILAPIFTKNNLLTFYQYFLSLILIREQYNTSTSPVTAIVE